MPEFDTGPDYSKLFVSPNYMREQMGLPLVYPAGFCQNCGNKITVQIFLGEDYCSDNCRKALGKDIK